MKRALILLIAGAVVGGGLVFLKMRSAATAAEAAPAADAAADSGSETRISHDTNGNVVIAISDDTRKEMGLQVTNPAPATFSPEVKGYGRVEDAAALAASVADLTSAQAAYTASSNELERLKMLASQGNASDRALQAAEAAAAHDRLAVQSVRDHLLLSTTPALIDSGDLSAFVQSLTERKSALVRIDLPAGEVSTATPLSARLSTLAGASADAQFLGAAAAADPTMQGRGYFFLVNSNTADLVSGAAVTGYLALPGTPLSGVIVPRDAVVRTEGTGWVYVQNPDAKSYTRKSIALEHAVEGGWFVTNLGPGDSIVAIGAQTLLSEELKASIQPD